MECVWSSPNRKTASKLEYSIKKLKKKEKEMLIKNENTFFVIFQETLDEKIYKREIYRL